jgi:methionyl aminopeptidase
MVFTIEPMINAGGYETKTLPDRWTICTRDGSLSAQFEHTLAITDGAAEILTLP